MIARDETQPPGATMSIQVKDSFASDLGVILSDNF